MKAKVQAKHLLQGKTLEKALAIINNDVDYIGACKYYWLSVQLSFDNVIHYVRFPHGNTLTIEFDENEIITKVY